MECGKLSKKLKNGLKTIHTLYSTKLPKERDGGGRGARDIVLV
jgi:hypothetical protein